MNRSSPSWRLPASIAAAGPLVAACSAQGRSSRIPPSLLPAPPTAAPTPSSVPDPVPIQLPRDDGPHDRLTEWWYYTGHLVAADGRHLGSRRSSSGPSGARSRRPGPPTWRSPTSPAIASCTPSDRRSEDPSMARRVIVRRADRVRPQCHGLRSVRSELAPAGAVALVGGGGRDEITAALSANEAATTGGSFGLALDLDSRRSRRRCTAQTAGSTSARPGPRTTTPERG